MNSRFCSPGKLLPYLFYLLVSFILMLCWRPVQAQQNVSTIRPLSIGDTVPDITIQNVLNYKRTSAKVADFQGKLLILDFWATWCSPCVSMIPRMDSLQQQYEGKVQFLAVSSEPRGKIDTFRAKYEKRFGKGITHPEVFADTVLRSLFRHNALPHYVWIDKGGVVRAVTDMGAISADKIESFLNAENLVLPEKKYKDYIPYDKDLPLFASGNGGDGTNIVYHSLFTSYTPNLQGVYNWNFDPKKGSKITVTNCSRYWLYRIAYAKGGGLLDEGSVVVESEHADKITTRLYGRKYDQWLSDNNGFTYELIVPPSFQEKTHAIMQKDLDNLFPDFTASMENRSSKALILISVKNGKQPPISKPTSKRSIHFDPFGWTITNSSPSALVKRFNQTQNHHLPMIDQTGISSKIDLQIEGNISDLAGLNKALASHGLQLIEKQVERQVLVIRDREIAKK